MEEWLSSKLLSPLTFHALGNLQRLRAFFLIRIVVSSIRFSSAHTIRCCFATLQSAGFGCLVLAKATRTLHSLLLASVTTVPVKLKADRISHTIA